MVEEIKKIELPPDMPNKPVKKKSRILVIVLIVLVVLLIVVGGIAGGAVLAFMPLKSVYAQAQVLMQSGKTLGTAIKSQNLAETKTRLAETRQQLTTFDTEYNKVRRLGFIPFLKPYVSDGEHAIKSGFEGLSAADKALEALEPNADLLGLKGKSNFVSGTADERIQVAVKTMSALIPKINEMAVHIEVVRKEMEQIDPARYPEEFRGIKVRSEIVSLKEIIDNSANLFVNAQPLLVNLPKMLGEPVEKRYLILFQNDKELRATGGFLTAFAQFRFVRGKAILERSDDIYNLDNSLKKKFPAPREILTFHKNVDTLNIRDSNLSPDFKVSMNQFEDMYQYTSGKEAIDGIIAMDTHVVVGVLKILGAINAGGRQFSADNDPRCDCPKAVYELEDYSSRPVNYVRTARKDIIGVLMQTMLQQALGVSPSKYWGSLFQLLLTEINEKHILAYFKDPDVQKASEAFNLGGRIMNGDSTAAVLKYQEGKGWDYLHINHSNMAGQKSNLFVKEKMIKDVTVNNDGTITTKLTVDYKNPFQGSDCNLERGGLCLNAPLRNWVRVYAPLGSKLVDSKGTQSPKSGQAEAMTSYDSLSKTVFEGFLIVNPLGTARLEVSYSSPVKSSDGKYRVLIQKQPGTDGQEYTIKLNGKEVKKFNLQTDTELTL